MSVANSLTTGNPLLDAWREIYGDQSYNWYDRYDFDADAFRRRRDLSSVYSFAVPSDEALDLIASYGPVVEVGAGTGYWARLLRDRGCDVLAYDLLGSAFNRWFPSGQYGGVERGGTRMAEVHADRTLLMVWPPMSEMAANALRYYERGGGRRLVYVGEGYGGCTADDDFFELVHGGCWNVCLHKPTWRLVRTVEIPQWDGIHDALFVYERAR